MKNILFTLGISTFLVACVSHQESDMTPVANCKSDDNVIPYENMVIQPDEEREALQSFKPVPQVSNVKSDSYMDWLAKKLRKELRSTGVQVKEVSGQIDLIVPNKSAFGNNQTKIQSGFKEPLSAVARLLKEYDQTMVQIIGYTDDMGSVLANKQISADKAEAIASFLKEQGVSDERIFVDGLGSDNPVANNATTAGRELNRRVEITLIGLQ